MKKVLVTQLFDESAPSARLIVYLEATESRKSIPAGLGAPQGRKIRISPGSEQYPSMEGGGGVPKGPKCEK